ncbi:MFS transporter [Spirillospora sp. CA-294931]|uniref:MFS transporter n=1 Tax=Spirillospora sp. CA-294931 TaxID=3240042 RepID=UPI003D92C0F1
MTHQTTGRKTCVPERERRGPSGGLILAVVLIGQFTAVLDINIVNVALPTLRADLNASGAELQLVVAGYIIAYAVLLITGARLGDLFGHRRMFLVGLSLFTAASLACGLAPGTGWLIAFRFLQGTGAALMSPQVMSLIQLNFTGAARARAFGTYSAVISCGVVAGQIAGGLLLSADVLGWRSVFLVNVPIGLALLAIAPRVLPAAEPRRRTGLDLPGLLVLTPATVLVVVPLILGHELGWPAWGWTSLAVGLALLPVFVLVERAVSRRGGRPLVSGRILRSPGLPPALVTATLGPGTWGAFLFTTTLHLQGDLGFGPLASGLAFMPSILGFALVSLRWQRLPAHRHAWLVPIGYTVAAVGYLLVGPFAGGGPLYFAATVVVGMGLGVMSVVLTVVLTHVPAEDTADGSGLMLTVMQIGQVLGIATIGSLFLTLSRDGEGSTRHAEWGTSWALAAVSLTAAVMAVFMARGSRPRAERDREPVTATD